MYDVGNYDDFRSELTNSDWNALKNENINTYAMNITNTILQNASKFIPNKNVLVRPHEPPWITNEIKLKIRKRKRLYRKARQSNNENQWHKFRTLRNEIITLIREKKEEHFDMLASKLNSGSLTPRD